MSQIKVQSTKSGYFAREKESGERIKDACDTGNLGPIFKNFEGRSRKPGG